MNEYEIDEARTRWHRHPVLGPATKTLRNLVDCANRNSDGWAYWPKPCRAAARLMELLVGDGTYKARFGEREDATVERLRAAYRPIKAFLTRNGLSCELVEPEEAVTAERVGQ
jgi:hypothetical protein